MNRPHAKVNNKFKYAREVREILTECILFALSFVIMPIELIFEICPFGLALLASSKRYTPFVLAGCIVSVIFNMDMSIPYLITIAAIMALRTLASVIMGADKNIRAGLNMEGRRDFFALLYTEKIGVRVAICAVCTLGLSVYNVVIAGFSYYEIFVLVFFTVVSALMCLAMCGIFEPKKSSSYHIGLCALAFSLVYAIRGYELFGIDLSIIISYALVLYTSRNISPSKGAAFGALLGICQKIEFVPIFSVASLISGFLWRISSYLGIISAFIISIGYGIFASGYEAIAYLVPELLLTSLVMYPLLKFEVLPRPRHSTDNGADVTVDEVHERQRSEEMIRGFCSVSGSLKEISKMLYDLGGSERVITLDNRYETCLEICESNCYSCPKKNICWERDVATTKENIDKLSSASYYNKNARIEDVDEKFLHRCPNIEMIVEKINARCREDEEALLKNDKFEICGKDYESISKIIESAATDMSKEMEYDEELSEKMRRCVDRIGLICKQIKVFGKEKKRLIATGVDIEMSRCSTATLISELEKVLGMRIELPIFEGKSPYGVMTVETSNRYVMESAKLTGKTDGEEQNGDTVSVFLSPDNKFYMLICDGMGTGKEASATSKMCAGFLKKLLTSSSNKQVSMSMVNSFIRNKSMECSCSVDLFEVDLASGDGCFVKSGAAPSFIKRKEKVFKLTSKTAPIGIMKSLDAEEHSFKLQENDVIVMVSDGVCASEEDIEWLSDMLSSASEQYIDTLPAKILSRVKERGIRSDDRSVCVAAVRKALPNGIE